MKVLAEAKIGKHPVVLTANEDADRRQRYAVGYRVYGRISHENPTDLDDALMGFVMMVRKAELEHADTVEV